MKSIFLKLLYAVFFVTSFGISQAETLLAHDKPTWNLESWAKAANLKLAPYTSDQYKSYVQTSLTAGNPPDIFTWWSGSILQDLVASGKIANVDELWTKKIASGEFSENQRKAFQINGKTYGIPLNTGHWVVFYNPKIFKKAGVTVPRTWAEFENVCNKLKAAGYIPINDGVDWGWNGYIWFSEFFIRSNPQAYEGLFTGKTSYNGPEAKAVFAKWGEWFKKGYYSDTRTNDQLAPFIGGKTAMYLMGDWIVGNFVKAGLKPVEDFDVFVMPNMKSGSPNIMITDISPILISNEAWADPAKRKAYEYLASVGAANAIADSQSIYMGNLKGKAPNTVVAKTTKLIGQGQYNLLTRWWEGVPADIQGDLVAQLNGYMVDPTPEKANAVMDKMQSINAEYWAKRK